MSVLSSTPSRRRPRRPRTDNTVNDAAAPATALPTPGEEPISATDPVDDKDLEDGEIEDDEEDDIPAETPKPLETPVVVPPQVQPKEKERDRRERDRKRPHDDKRSPRHMTEAEKSILHLRRREKMQREKWEKYRKDTHTVEPPVDDFASNIEKALASVLKKDSKQTSDEEKEDDKRGRKRKTRDKDRQKSSKQRRLESPKKDDIDDSESVSTKGGSPRSEDKKDREGLSTSPRSGDSYDSEESVDERRDKKKDFSKRGKNRNRDRNRRRSREKQQNQQALNDAQGVCVFFLQGKCQKNDCPYSHEAVPPMKLELCKFYLKECCAKGEKCSYMHGEFPCKFYHTGLVCLQGDNCKFAHGRPLDDHRKQILFKHIETAPRELLGGFPRMSREEALNKINVAQQNLVTQYGPDTTPRTILNLQAFLDANVPMPSELNSEGGRPKGEKSRNRPSRWQDPEPKDVNPASYPPFNYGGQDLDMRVNSNGDIDMRTLPPLAQLDEQPPTEMESQNFTQDIDIRNPSMIQFDTTKDVDIRQQILASKDIDIRQIPVFDDGNKIEDDDEEESKLQIDTGEDETISIPPNLPKTQRDLYLRIQSQQKTNLPTESESFNVQENINWYSDDDDDDENRLTIKVDNEEEKKDECDPLMSPPQIKPLEVVEKLGDLSKIDISAEVTKLLTSMTQTANVTSPKQSPKPVIRDPRQKPQQEKVQQDKVSIYDQGSIPIESTPKSPDEFTDTDLRSRPDVDLRSLHLPFKGMQNYTPAKEIDASVNSHPPIVWKVKIVDIPRPDYTGLKLSIQDAEKTGDPRLRKIFRLSTEEKDSPASPKASPKAGGAPRIDPRLKKQEEIKQQQQDPSTLNYNQQLTLLQNSAFFQSLTSTQKVLLNQEVAVKNDQNGFNDPVLNSMLTSLNLIPSNNMSNPNMGAALNILASVNKLNPPMMGAPSAPNPMVLNQNQNMMNRMVQPGLLGAAPGIPNIPSDFPMNFDPRNSGNMMNNVSGPPGPFNNFPPPDNSFNNFEEYYPPQDNFHPNNRDNRNFNRDRRRGRSNFNRNNANRNFRNRNNRNNRGPTPP